MNNFLSIGQFAKLCETTIDTLIHYEELGLLSPSKISDTRRKLYDVGQYHTFVIIRTLSDSGIPLSDIQSSLSSRDTLSDLINKRQLHIRQQLLRLTQLQNSLNHTDLNLLLPSTFLYNCPFIQTRTNSLTLFATFAGYSPLSHDMLHSSVIHHKSQCHLINISPHPLGIILQKKSLYAQNNRRIFLYSPYPDGVITNQTPIQDTGEYAVILHTGSLESINDSISVLYNFIENRHCRIAGNTYINYFHKSLPGITESFYLIKVRFLPR